MENKIKGLIAAGAAGVGLIITGIVLSRKTKTPSPPAQANKANFYGYVTDSLTSKPLNGVTVVVGIYTTTTNTSGYYLLPNIPVGGYTPEYSLDGYKTVTHATMTIAPGNNRLDIALTEISPPADFTLSNLQLTPSTPFLEEGVVATLTVTNNSSSPGAKTLTLNISGMDSLEQDVVLQGGQTTTVTFNIFPAQTGSYTVSIDNLTGSFTVVPFVASVAGRVVDESGTPLDGVLVTLLGFSVNMTTGADGKWTFSDLKYNLNHQVYFKKDGYNDNQITFLISAPGEYEAGDITLTAIPPPPPPPPTTVRLTIKGLSNPESFWGMTIYAPGGQAFSVGGATKDVPSATVSIQSKDFMIIPNVQPSWPIFYPNESGPYKVVVPDWGDYTMDMSNPTVIEGATVTSLFGTGSRIELIANGIQEPAAIAGVGYPAIGYGSAQIISCSSGDIGRYLVGQTITAWWSDIGPYAGYVTAYSLYYQPNTQCSGDLSVAFWNDGYPGLARALAFVIGNMTKG